MFSPAARAAGQVSTTYSTALAGLLFPGDKGFVNNMMNPVYTHFMPRFGFAWDVFGDGKTSLRGGAGQFYDTRLPGVFDNIFANSVPFVAAVNVTFDPATTGLGSFTNPYSKIAGGNPFPALQPPPANSFSFGNFQSQSYSTFDPTTFRVPVTISWNLAVEQQLTSTLSSRIAYVGSRSTHQQSPQTSTHLQPEPEHRPSRLLLHHRGTELHQPDRHRRHRWQCHLSLAPGIPAKTRNQRSHRLHQLHLVQGHR